MRHTLLTLPLLLTPMMVAAQTASPTESAIAAGEPATAEHPAAAADAMEAEEEITVTGQKPPGSVIGDIQPEVTLSPADVRSYGVNNVSDLLDQLAPQTTSGRGQGAPVVLLNGRRITGFGEIRDLPTEAILRVEILPEEVSLKYGYSADQRVVNFVLRQRFRTLVAQAGAGIATEGGGENTNPEVNLVRIRRDQRLSVNLRYQGNAKLKESQRDVQSIASGQPYDLAGNVTAPIGSASAEIDPALSALVGQAVTVAGVPVTGRTLADFAATANTPNVTDVSRYRTLRGSSQQISTNIVYSQPAFGRSTATVNGSLAYTETDALRGLPGATLAVPDDSPFSPFGGSVAVQRYLSTDPLHQRGSTLDGHLGLGLNGDRGNWRWTVTGNYDHSDTRTRTDRSPDIASLQDRLTALDPALDPFGPLPDGLVGGARTDRARSIANSGELQAMVGGPVAKLPAGPINTNLRVGLDYIRLDSSSERAGLRQSGDLDRRNASGQINVDLPIASRRNGVLPWLGSLSLNGNAAVRDLSDFGTLTTYGGGVTWTPVTRLNLIGSFTRDEAAPTVQQLGNPTVITPQVRVFDYVAGTTVDVTQTSGGNPDLDGSRRRVLKLGATLKPLNKGDLTLIANYVRTRTTGSIFSLPEPTIDVEGAFPDRFVRDAAGRLISVDTRSVNFDSERRDELRIGFNASINLKSIMQRKFEAWRAAREAGQDVPPPFPIPQRRQQERAQQSADRQQAGDQRPRGEGASPSDGPPPGDAPAPPPGGGAGPGGGVGGGPGGFGRGGGGGFGRGQGGGRLQFALYDTWTLKSDILIRRGLPVIDLLNGGSIGSGGGTSRHRVEGQVGYSNNGLGARLSADWQSATAVRGGDTGALGDLHFSPLATADLRLFADFGQMPAFVGKPWARGLRLTFAVNNITNERQRVRDAAGDTPLRYQPAYLDALGRTVMVTVRKLLF
ncbi:TonB-dependent receptor [uncultured Sphingomonas sp.]|uniref:TonB-dependent receptor n=1 Tax=uncultured Sphingomonas sp. TaxID=158754 RepID=UPI0025F27AF7|nr:TonB-dependent receptor [uncultured Sphingomonas sp.]